MAVNLKGKMKTFYEWLELNEAGLFSNLFGAKKQIVPQNVNQETPEEKERKKQSQAHDDVMRMLVPDYKPPAEVLSRSVSSTSPKVAQPSPKQLQPKNFAGGDLYDHLYNLIGDRTPLMKKIIDNKENKNIDQQSRIYQIFKYLSLVKSGYEDEDAMSATAGMSAADIEKAYEIIEKILNQDYNLYSYPDKKLKDLIVPYEEPDWDWKDYYAGDALISGDGPWENNPRPAVLISKGFRKGNKFGKKAITAVVSTRLY